MWGDDYFQGRRQQPTQGSFEAAQICLNGHVINSMCRKYPELNKAHCSECGEKTITHCQSCNQLIKGRYELPSVVDFSPFHKSAYCDSCGQPYPWTQRSQEAATELIEFSDALSQTEKDDFKNSIKDLIVQSPKTNLAVAKYKTYIKKAGTEITKGLKDVLVDIVSEAVKKSIWG